MRTTLDLNDAVLKEAKRRAAENGRSLTAFIEDALRVAVKRLPRGAKPKLRVSRKGLGLKKGLTYDDTSALLDLMDAQDVRR